MKIRSNTGLAAAALAVVVLSGCSTQQDAPSPAQTTASLTPTATSSSTTPTTSSTSPPRVSTPPTSSTATARTSTSSASASPSSSTKRRSYICHYEEGDEPCSRAEYKVNQKAWPEYQRQNESPSATPSSTSIARDKNGFALGGPPAPTSPANYDNPSRSECRRYLKEVRAWSAYQNKHRPVGSTNNLPFRGDVEYLYTACGLNY